MVVIEDNLVRGGVGSVVREHLAGRRIDVPVRTFGIPSTFLDHAGRASVLDQIGLTAVTISDEVIQDITPRAADVSAFRPRAG